MWSALMLYSSLSEPRPRHAATGSRPSRQSDSMNRDIHAGQVADEAEAAWYFGVVEHRFGEKTLRIGGGDAHGRLAFRGNRGGEALVQ